MADRVPFINREDELAQIEGLVGEWGTRRALCIHGPGGIGKTRLIQEVRQRYAEGGDKEAPLLVTDTIDFDDRSFHISENVGRRIAAMLGESAFEPYLRRLTDYRKMQMTGISQERLTQESLAANIAFTDCFNKVSSERRVVLLLDTIDALEETDMWDYMLGLGLQLENAVLLLAGRNAKDLWKEIRLEIEEDAQLLTLQPLEQGASEQYLRKKQDSLHIALDPEIAQKLLLLAQGRPILIDLAVEWTAREIPLDWLIESSLDELEALFGEGMRKRQEEFETHLVHHITQIRTPMDRLTLVLSRVYPLDTNMIIELLKIPKEKAEALFEEAQTYAFVKLLPDRRISLHDEMRRMVNVHVWPEVDPDGDRQHRDSKLAGEYLKREVQTLKKRIDQLAGEEKAAREKQDVETELSIFVEREALERELWVLEGQRLRHILLVDLDDGVQTFIDLFHKATQAYHFSFRETLITQVQQFANQLSLEQRYKVDIKRAQNLIDDGQYPRAKELLLEMLGREEISPEQHVDISIQLGNVEIRLGNFEEGITYFADAVKQSVQNNLEELLIAAENALGWAHRLVGDWAEAAAHYKSALRRSLGSEDKHQRALILNNLGYVIGLQPTEEEDVALPLCKQALEIWQELGYARGVGQVLCTKGEILRFHNRLAESLEYFNEAAQIFEPANDLEWLSNVYCGRGIVQFLLDNLEAAQFDLEKAREIGLRRDEPRYLHYLGHVALAQDNIEEARDLFKESYDVSQVTHDLYFEVNSLGDLANIATIQREFNRRPEFKKRLKRYLEKHPEALSRDVGLLLGYLGDLALSEGDLDEAIQNYQEGFLLLTKSGGYGPYTLVGHLERKERHWKEWESEDIISSDSIREIGKRLEQFWIKKELDFTHIQALLFFTRWKGWGREAE